MSKSKKNILDKNILKDLLKKDVSNKIPITPVINLDKYLGNLHLDTTPLPQTEAKLMTKIGEDDYVRPKITFFDRLTGPDIKKYLENHIEIESEQLCNIKKGSSLRYFIKENNKYKFRTGGILLNNSGLPAYIVLSNGKRSWSVQIENSIFYKKIDVSDITKQYEQEVVDYKKTIINLNNEIIKLKETIEKNEYESDVKIEKLNNKLKKYKN